MIKLLKMTRIVLVPRLLFKSESEIMDSHKFSEALRLSH
jgi:hypothetical protein